MNSNVAFDQLVDENVFSVSEYIEFVNGILDAKQVTIQGEVGGKPNEYPGYAFFNILDTEVEAKLNCFVGRDVLKELAVSLEEGMEVQLVGYPQIFAKNGRVSFQVKRIMLVGEGQLKRQFEALKKKLTQEGLFAQERKQELPSYIEKIGLITSAHARGAKKDFETNLVEYGLSLFFFDVRVEGASAIDDICQSIRWFNERSPDVDVLVVTRGGGSWESLQAFNSEPVARALSASKIPIIVGVGHEDDVTIADLVADYRASTPTAAAKVISKPWEEAQHKINHFETTLEREIQEKITQLLHRFKLTKEQMEITTRNKLEQLQTWCKHALQNLEHYFQHHLQYFESLTQQHQQNAVYIGRKIEVRKKELDEHDRRFNIVTKKWLKTVDNQLQQSRSMLHASSPELKLRQGYSMTFNEHGDLVKSVKDVDKTNRLRVKVSNGTIITSVESTNLSNE